MVALLQRYRQIYESLVKSNNILTLDIRVPTPPHRTSFLTNRQKKSLFCQVLRQVGKTRYQLALAKPNPLPRLSVTRKIPEKRRRVVHIFVILFVLVLTSHGEGHAARPAYHRAEIVAVSSDHSRTADVNGGALDASCARYLVPTRRIQGWAPHLSRSFP